MTEDQANALKKALQQQFGGDVEAEPVNGQGRYRFAIVSASFEPMTHLERQDAIWQVVDRVLPREATLDVSLILALTPGELTPAD